jgi:cellulose synthase/poly-beta-1,6-N-acetylglucosamine synthase-like glycosyltransferase/peptidoglycan/xylan/chitin deacetylase (PgdA/CDA1 family)
VGEPPEVADETRSERLAGRLRAARRKPKAHWVALSLVLLCFLTLVALHGYVHGDAGPTPGAAPPRSPGAGLVGAGPVLDLGHSEVRSAGPGARQVALTFDGGPDPALTPAILDVLASEHVPATFFVLGSRAAEHPSLVQREVASGHEIGVQAFTFTDLGRVPRWRANLEVSLTQQVLTGITGRTSVLLRPPYATTADALTGAELSTARRMSRAGYLIVLSTQVAGGARHATADETVREALPPTGHGGVIALHDGAGDPATTVAALRELIDTLKARHYRFEPVSALIGSRPSTLMAPVGGVERLRGQGLLAVIKAADVVMWVVGGTLVVLLALSVLRVLFSVSMAGVHARRTRHRSEAAAASGLEAAAPVSIVVPAYNEEVGIAATVQSLLASDHAAIEVIVVDDGSTDATAVRALAAAGGDPRVSVVSRVNGGKPAALNTGVAAAEHDFIVLMDGDTVFQADTVRRLVGPLAANPRIGAVSGNTKVGNRDGLLGLWQHLEYVFGFNLDRRLFDLLGCLTTVPGAVGAFRREALEAVGGVSDDTLAEDTDLTMALVRARWQVVYQDDAVAWTEVPASLSSLWRQRYRWSYGTLQSMWKHRGAIRERSTLGWVALPWMFVFQLVLPVIAPVIDVWALYGFFFGDLATALWVWLGLAGLQLLVGAYALHLDRERLRVLWALPLQQFLYRQLMYLVVIQSLVASVQGQRLRWHKLRRLGMARPTESGAVP